MSINVGRISSKLYFGFLQDKGKEYDVVGLCETKTNLFDHEIFENYRVFTGENF